MIAAATSMHLFWLTSRAAGTTALVLSSLALSMGLAMALGERRGGLLGRLSAIERRSLHEALALATMVAIAIHGLSLIGDSYLHPSIIDVTVPFASSYKTLPTSLGILAGWGLILLGLSYYLRGRIGVRRWRRDPPHDGARVGVGRRAHLHGGKRRHAAVVPGARAAAARGPRGAALHAGAGAAGSTAADRGRATARGALGDLRGCPRCGSL